MILTAEGMLQLAKSAGLRVIPCRPGTKLPLTPHGFRADETEAAAALKAAPHDCNIAVIAGSASGGVVGVDCETEEVAWSLFDRREAVLGATWCIRTPHGGVVVLVRAVDLVPDRRIRLAGEEHPFDLCGEGGYFLVHGAIDHSKCDPKKVRCPHRGLTRYETISRTLRIMDSFDTVNALIERCASLGWAANAGRWPPVRKVAGGVPEGSRNRAAFVMGRYLLFTLGMDPADALFALQAWNRRNKPPMQEGELKAVIASAAKYPRTSAQRWVVAPTSREVLR